jgi:hypothetical protein
MAKDPIGSSTNKLLRGNGNSNYSNAANALNPTKGPSECSLGFQKQMQDLVPPRGGGIGGGALAPRASRQISHTNSPGILSTGEDRLPTLGHTPSSSTGSGRAGAVNYNNHINKPGLRALHVTEAAR